MGRPSLRGVFVTLLLLVVGFHFVSVTAAALPPNRYSEVVEPVNGYLRPYFTQNWRLFAPNPIAADRDFLVQGAYRSADGTVQLTDWINWTDVELDLIRHKIVGRRAGYVTTKMASALLSSRGALTTDQREVLREAGAQEAPLLWSELVDELHQHGTSPARVSSYVRYERAAVRLATDVLIARYPEAEIIAIRYNLRRIPVVDYDKRHVEDKAAERQRRTTSDISGWRRPVSSTSAERDVISDFDRRHR
ncbi:MAG TPA: DUF5819 family protein [Aeromicrobium sp.]|nr:DUF5819 family protein [Aeromicrobium sp.]